MSDKPVNLDDGGGAAVKRRAVNRGEMTRMQWTLREMKVNKVGYLMVAPFFVLFTIFTIFPVLLSIILSLTVFNLVEFPTFVFLDNYIRLLFDDDIFLKAITNTLVFAAVTGPVSYMLSFMMAWFINELSPKMRAFVTLIFYAPSISGQVYLIWQVLFHSDQYGYANSILLRFNFIQEPILWFQDANYVMNLCIVVALWLSLSTSFLAFIAGLQTVDRTYYEAGAVDGIRNRWQELWYVTLPLMKNQLMFGAVMTITGSFGFGVVVTALAGFPSIDYAAHTIMHHLDDYGGMRFEMGYASAIATLLFFMMMGANLIVKRLLSKVGT
ncbi:MAG: sugar ABC transporter permease [Oscillospiraceae bacterium]|nr:sugar ABC transporter permease [Oscillospiraceae bacterium]